MPPCGSVKLLWLEIVLDQFPCTSGWPSASFGPVHLPDAIFGNDFSYPIPPPIGVWAGLVCGALVCCALVFSAVSSAANPMTGASDNAAMIRLDKPSFR